MPKIHSILENIDLGNIALPHFQRGYVWRRPQIRALFRSLYRRHPVGSLLVWDTSSGSVETRGPEAAAPAAIRVLLDGQQRISTIYGVARGKPPVFFDKNPRILEGLRFHLEDEEFEFYSSKMKDDPYWVDVTRVLRDPDFLDVVFDEPALGSSLKQYARRLTHLHGILTLDLHIESIAGNQTTPDEVVDIFNQVNSGGTKLSKGDLALAKVSAAWPQAREKMGQHLASWHEKGYEFSHDWLLRCINVLITGEAKFAHLHKVDRTDFQKGLKRTCKHINLLLTLIEQRLGLDKHQAMLPVSAFPVLVRYIDQKNGMLTHTEQNEILHWYVQAGMWGRYAGSVETALNQDVDLLDRGGINTLVGQLRQQRGSLEVTPEQFLSWSRGARFFPILYMLTFRGAAKDFCHGTPLIGGTHFGSMKDRHLHHIFPKAQLYKQGYNRPQVNALANFCFLTAECNLKISDSKPEEYLPQIRDKQPGALESQWIPMDENLWEIENYERFLEARRQLLAAETNRQLNILLDGPEANMPVRQTEVSKVRPATAIADRVPGGVADDAEQQLIDDLRAWMKDQYLPEGQLSFELADATTGNPLAVLDLAWPLGIQEGLTHPVAVLLDEPLEVLSAANMAGFKFFTTVEKFKDYVRVQLLT